MSDLEALWRAVLANPDEDTPRLMYADEVQESDPARAEFIRAHCELWRHSRAGELDETLAQYRRACAAVVVGCRERWEPACVVCGGKGHSEHWDPASDTMRRGAQCRACSGTGRQPCRWERGFPVVQVAQMRDAWRVGPTVRQFQFQREPTPWLCALLSTHHVAGVVPGDVLPFFHQARPAVTSNQSVPPAVLARCSGFYATPEQATAALGRAVVLAALEWLDARGAE